MSTGRLEMWFHFKRIALMITLHSYLKKGDPIAS